MSCFSTLLCAGGVFHSASCEDCHAGQGTGLCTCVPPPLPPSHHPPPRPFWTTFFFHPHLSIAGDSAHFNCFAFCFLSRVFVFLFVLACACVVAFVFALLVVAGVLLARLCSRSRSSVNATPSHSRLWRWRAIRKTQRPTKRPQRYPSHWCMCVCVCVCVCVSVCL